MIVNTAKNAMQNAIDSGFGWTIWDKMIEQSESALKDGDAQKAALISYKIIKQSDSALKQAEASKKAGPSF